MFLRDWGISNCVSSAVYSQSNGIIEVSVKSKKKLIRGSWTAGCFNIDELSKGFFLYRSAPISGEASPAQLVFYRPVRDCLLAHRRAFAPQWQKSAAEMKKSHACSPLQQDGIIFTAAADWRSCRNPKQQDKNVVSPLNSRWDRNFPFLSKTPTGRLFRRFYTPIAYTLPHHQQLDSPTPPPASATSFA